MEIMDYVWLAVTILAAIAEAATAALVSIWFVAGGMAALIGSLLGAPLWLQLVLFFAVSILALFLTRPLARRAKGRNGESTNADMVLGRAALVTEAIDNVLGRGRVTVMGNNWSARSAGPGGTIPEGTSVRVERIEGVKLIVSPIKSEKEEGEAV